MSQMREREQEAQMAASLKMTKKEWAVLGGAVAAFGVQIYTQSMPLGALLGLLVMVVFGGIEYRKIDKIMDSGLAMMGFIAFIMLVAAGFGSVLREKIRDAKVTDILTTPKISYIRNSFKI